MSDGPEQVHRFSRFQVVFHWVVGLPYLVLLASGALIMLHRLDLPTILPPNVLSIVHRWTGIAFTFFVLQLLFSALITGNLRSVARDFLDWFKFSKKDLLWLLLLPLNILSPHRFPLPPVGRFNAGQKLHGAFVVLAVVLLSVTGVLIMYRPAALRPWLIHSWLFFGAAAFLSLHLFLSLINPVTRRALGGIFSGYVSRDYVADHHPLELADEHVEHRPHAVVSPTALVVTAAIAALLGGVALMRYGPHRAMAKVTRISHTEHPMISPGPLIAAHADHPKAVHCEACHEGLEPPKDSACLACHPEIDAVMRAKLGFHGQLAGECRTCHTDHKGRDADVRGLDEKQFNHRLARFELIGKHRELQCDECHVEHSPEAGQRRFIGLAFQSCTDCHANPHPDLAQADCRRCHAESGWKGRDLIFAHDRDTKFHLEGNHADVMCEKCHSPVRAQLVTTAAPALRAVLPPPAPSGQTSQRTIEFRLHGIGKQCAECHADPHRPSLSEECRKCHTVEGWTGGVLTFRHDRDTKFRLEGAHAAADCKECHKLSAPGGVLAQAELGGLATACASCHDDPHRNQLGQDCRKCHTESHWTGKQLLFAHDRDSDFPLKGKHAAVGCAECHKPAGEGAKLATAPFKDLSHKCADCHEDPHRTQFKQQACTTCHDEHGWRGKQLLFDHQRDSDFKLDATHRTLECAACHKPEQNIVAYRGTARNCEECHADVAAAMAGTNLRIGAEADPHFGRATCADCHPATLKAPTAVQYADACQGCHGARYRTVFFDWQKSLDSRSQSLRDLIVKKGQSGAADGERALREARKVGMHNVAEAVKMLDAARGEK